MVVLGMYERVERRHLEVILRPFSIFTRTAALGMKERVVRQQTEDSRRYFNMHARTDVLVMHDTFE